MKKVAGNSLTMMSLKSINTWVDYFAIRAFRDTADGDYIAARLSSRSALLLTISLAQPSSHRKIPQMHSPLESHTFESVYPRPSEMPLRDSQFEQGRSHAVASIQSLLRAHKRIGPVS